MWQLWFALQHWWPLQAYSFGLWYDAMNHLTSSNLVRLDLRDVCNSLRRIHVPRLQRWRACP